MSIKRMVLTSIFLICIQGIVFGAVALNNGDKIRGDAASYNVIDYTLYGFVNNIPTQLADGQLATSTADLYTAGSPGIAVSSMVLVNTTSTAQTINLYVLPSAGTARRVIPKDISLGAGYSLHTDGIRITVTNTSGEVLTVDGSTIEDNKSAFGELLTGELHPQFQGSFEYTVDNTDLNTNTVANGGTVTQASGMAVVGTSTTTASTALFESKQHGRYKSGLGGVDRFTVLYTSPVAATEQYIGLADETGSSAAFKNGYMVGYDGTTFGFNRFQNDTKFTVALSAWDDPLDGSGASGATIDQTKLNVFFIQYQYLGGGAVKIHFEKQNGDIVLAHTLKYAGLFTEPSTHNPNFHHTMWVNNKATTDNLILKSSSYAYFVEGRTSFIELHQPENGSGTKQKTSVTSTEVAILTIRNKSTYASKTNFIDIVLLGAGASIEANSANNLATIRVVKNATLGGTPSYSDINTTDSVVEIDTSGTTVTGGKELEADFLAGKNDKFRSPLIDNKIILNPGDTLTIAGSSANSATINARATWRELF